jgi:hypothetical protein
MVLGTTKLGPGLNLCDDDGELRVARDVIKDGPSQLIMLDENGMLRTTLAITQNGTGLFLSNEKGKPRAGRVATHEGPGLHLYDKGGKRIWTTPKHP